MAASSIPPGNYLVAGTPITISQDNSVLLILGKGQKKKIGTVSGNNILDLSGNKFAFFSNGRLHFLGQNAPVRYADLVNFGNIPILPGKYKVGQNSIEISLNGTITQNGKAIGSIDFATGVVSQFGKPIGNVSKDGKKFTFLKNLGIPEAGKSFDITRISRTFTDPFKHVTPGSSPPGTIPPGTLPPESPGSGGRNLQPTQPIVTGVSSAEIDQLVQDLINTKTAARNLLAPLLADLDQIQAAAEAEAAANREILGNIRAINIQDFIEAQKRVEETKQGIESLKGITEGEILPGLSSAAGQIGKDVIPGLLDALRKTQAKDRSSLIDQSASRLSALSPALDRIIASASAQAAADRGLLGQVRGIGIQNINQAKQSLDKNLANISQAEQIVGQRILPRTEQAAQAVESAIVPRLLEALDRTAATNRAEIIDKLARLSRIGAVSGLADIGTSLGLNRAIESESANRLLGALRGELDLPVFLKEDLERREQQLRDQLRRNLGTGFETSTAGIEALRGLERTRAGVLDEFRRQEIERALGVFSPIQGIKSGLREQLAGLPGIPAGISQMAGAEASRQLSDIGKVSSDLISSLLARQGFTQAGVDALANLIGLRSGDAASRLGLAQGAQQFLEGLTSTSSKITGSEILPIAAKSELEKGIAGISQLAGQEEARRSETISGLARDLIAALGAQRGFVGAKADAIRDLLAAQAGDIATRIGLSSSAQQLLGGLTSLGAQISGLELMPIQAKTDFAKSGVATMGSAALLPLQARATGLALLNSALTPTLQTDIGALLGQLGSAVSSAASNQLTSAGLIQSILQNQGPSPLAAGLGALAGAGSSAANLFALSKLFGDQEKPSNTGGTTFPQAISSNPAFSSLFTNMFSSTQSP